MGFSAAQWFLRLARYELVHRGTRPNTLRYCQQLNITWPFFNSFRLSPDMSFVRYLIWTPLAPVWHKQRPTHWFNPALFCSNLFPNFFPYPVWNVSAVVQLKINLCFMTSSSFPALAPGLGLCPSFAALPHPWLQISRPWSVTNSHWTFHPLRAPRLSSV